MNWFNKDKTKMIKLEAIESYEFRENASTYEDMTPELKVYFNNRTDILYADDAKRLLEFFKNSY